MGKYEMVFTSYNNQIFQSSYDVGIGDDRVHAAVVVKPGINITKVYISDFIKNNLEDHKQISGDIQFLNAIPHNPQGKKLRRVLKLQYTQIEKSSF